jgi:hypothetical protein
LGRIMGGTTTYVFCKTKMKMVIKGTERNHQDDAPRGHMVIGPLEPFHSPITGEEITSRKQLAAHNKAHGVTNSADYSKEWYQSKEKQRHRELNGDTKRQRNERIADLQNAMRRN